MKSPGYLVVCCLGAELASQYKKQNWMDNLNGNTTYALTSPSKDTMKPMAQGPQGFPGYHCGFPKSYLWPNSLHSISLEPMLGVPSGPIYFLTSHGIMETHPEIFTGNEGFLHVRNTTSNIPKDLHVAKGLLQSVIETSVFPGYFVKQKGS